ncbi:MAG: flagellar motor protein MotB, partial [Alphaproteobacteria bacterium]
MAETPPTLGEEPIIKKIKKGGHGGHHGGAWKIAYADFVTAMMAFFLLLWLLSSTTEEQKRGIADYYNFGSVENAPGGTIGIMDGATIEAPNAKPDKSYDPVFADPTTMSFNLPPTVEDDSKTERTLQISKNTNTKNGEEDEDKAKEKKRQLIQKLQAQDEAKLKQTREKILKSLEKDSSLSKLLPNVQIDVTPEGLLIQLTDKDKRQMFELGSAKPMPEAISLLQAIAKVAIPLPNPLIISG